MKDLVELATRIMDEMGVPDKNREGQDGSEAQSPSEIAIREFRRAYRARLVEAGILSEADLESLDASPKPARKGARSGRGSATSRSSKGLAR